MRVTKLTHSCLVLEGSDGTLIIDPGDYSDPAELMPHVENAVGLIITDTHSDHYSPRNVAAIRERRPDIPILVNTEIAAMLEGSRAARPGDKIALGSFNLEFYGGEHAPIYGHPRAVNLGVMVNGALAYSGDSFDVPPTTPEVLAVPVGGPWANTSQAIEFLDRVKPTRFGFNVHDAHLSAEGMDLTHRFFDLAMRGFPDMRFRQLENGDSFEL